MISRKFLALLEAEDLKDKVALDVGCGAGRLALLLASRCRRVVGIDRDAAAIAEARERAAAGGIDNAQFRVMDAEAVEYHEFAPQLIVAYLCMSDAIMARSGDRKSVV